jgi:LPXTG-site transpeptidase (sortase) family protein
VNRPPYEVFPNDISVVANTPEVAKLTLTTCHPKGSAKKRLIIEADMVTSTVRDGA